MINPTHIKFGIEFPDVTSEAEATLSLAILCRDKLLDEGYNVLMIREDNDAGLDNIARTVIANNMADCHIALHYDSTESDKGVFYMSVPDIGNYREMDPVKDHWRDHHALGDAIISGMEAVGDTASDLSERTQNRLAKGIVNGINKYYKKGAR